MKTTTNQTQKSKKKKPEIRSIEELEKYMREHRSEDMLTVKDLIAYLKKQNPNACILGYEPNSLAYIEQPKDLKHTVMTVREDKVRAKADLENWYRHDPEDVRNQKVKKDMDEMYRYSEDDDVIIKIGG